eukprot:3230581-Amphidinium_carterae.1
MRRVTSQLTAEGSLCVQLTSGTSVASIPADALQIPRRPTNVPSAWACTQLSSALPTWQEFPKATRRPSWGGIQVPLPSGCELPRARGASTSEAWEYAPSTADVLEGPQCPGPV